MHFQDPRRSSSAGQGARAELGIAAPAKPTARSTRARGQTPAAGTAAHGIQPGITTVLGEQPHGTHLRSTLCEQGNRAL